MYPLIMLSAISHGSCERKGMSVAAYAIWRKEAWTFSLCLYIAGAIWGAGGIVKGLSEGV